MSTDGTIIITDAGHDRINAAINGDSAVEITHIAMGDGLGSNYEPTENRTSLKRELARVPISRRHTGGDKTWVIKAEFDAETTAAFSVREIAFIDNGGVVIFIWAGSEVASRQTGAIDYLIDHALSLDRIKDGLVVVSAPDDEVFDLALHQANTNFTIMTEQLRQGRALALLQSKET
jgi:hypothetical protein